MIRFGFTAATFTPARTAKSMTTNSPRLTADPIAAGIRSMTARVSATDLRRPAYVPCLCTAARVVVLGRVGSADWTARGSRDTITALVAAVFLAATRLRIPTERVVRHAGPIVACHPCVGDIRTAAVAAGVFACLYGAQGCFVGQKDVWFSQTDAGFITKTATLKSKKYGIGL